MAVHHEAMVPGLVIKQRETDAPSRAFYRVEEFNDGIDKWEATHVATGKSAHIDPSELDAYDAVSPRVFCDIDLTALIGRRVRLVLKWGELSGEFQEVRSVEFCVGLPGDTAIKPISIPTHIVVETDVIPVAEIVKITRL